MLGSSLLLAGCETVGRDGDPDLSLTANSLSTVAAQVSASQCDPEATVTPLPQDVIELLTVVANGSETPQC